MRDGDSGTRVQYPRVIFHPDYTERDQDEMTDRGYCSAAMVEAEDGSRYPVFFYDPVRLQQDLTAYAEGYGEHWLAEPGLIVLDEVTVERMQAAVQRLWEEGFFEHLKPLAAPDG